MHHKHLQALGTVSQHSTNMVNRCFMLAHLSSVHRRDDTRIFGKMCVSCSARNYPVALIVADGKGDAEMVGARVIDVGQSTGKLRRMFVAARRVRERATTLGCKLYHLHDPELLTIASGLRMNHCAVVFDAHEDIPKDILSKPYIPRSLRMTIAALYRGFETFALRNVSAVVAATPAISKQYEGRVSRVVTIQNFPLLDEFPAPGPFGQRDANTLAYVGDLTAIRGVREFVEALGIVGRDVVLEMAGTFSEVGLRDKVASLTGWGKVKERGHLSRLEVQKLLAKARAGILTFLPAPNHTESQPNKLFEYMAAGLPVIASNFPAWRKIVERHQCGLCVDPAKPEEIAAAIQEILENPDRAAQMGQAGRKAVEQHYCWATEEKRLLELYDSLL
jgi:glycosyltransferase involved in cell wall biosynthesis